MHGVVRMKLVLLLMLKGMCFRLDERPSIRLWSWTALSSSAWCAFKQTTKLRPSVLSNFEAICGFLAQSLNRQRSMKMGKQERAASVKDRSQRSEAELPFSRYLFATDMPSRPHSRQTPSDPSDHRSQTALQDQRVGLPVTYHPFSALRTHPVEQAPQPPDPW